ncbi:MAG: TetR/AcrR family transcriptional regulator [Cytophagales bacterium]|nr:MAG: TetR/AcrR family transcriptional regulator [Cytophagales bacterium]
MKAKDENKEIAIIDAALQIIFTEGLVGLRMEHVAKVAKVATGTVYLYFKNKEELINHLFLRFKRESMKALELQIDSQVPFKINFMRVWQSYLQFSLENPAIATLLEQLHQSNYLSAEARKEAEDLLNPIRNLLEEGKKQLLIKPIDNELLLSFLSGSINQLARRLHEKQINITNTHIEQAFEMAWDSVRL